LLCLISWIKLKNLPRFSLSFLAVFCEYLLSYPLIPFLESFSVNFIIALVPFPLSSLYNLFNFSFLLSPCIYIKTITFEKFPCLKFFIFFKKSLSILSILIMELKDFIYIYKENIFYFKNFCNKIVIIDLLTLRSAFENKYWP